MYVSVFWNAISIHNDRQILYRNLFAYEVLGISRDYETNISVK